MRKIGFSSGAIAGGDFMGAMDSLRNKNLDCLELSALRLSELGPLLNALPHLNLSQYSYVSLHAPSKFQESEEAGIAGMLYSMVPITWPIIIHPDAIFNFKHWMQFGNRLAIENMDRRKAIGRNVSELQSIFARLPEATLCFDVGHARQYDTSMTEAFLILSQLRNRLAQIHISEVNSESRHDPISFGAKLAFRRIADLIPESIPVIVESRVLNNQISNEAINAQEALTPANRQ